jgi:hypothetical protein
MLWAWMRWRGWRFIRGLWRLEGEGGSTGSTSCIGRRAGFSATQFAKTQTASVEMTGFWEGRKRQRQPRRTWLAVESDLASR